MFPVWQRSKQLDTKEQVYALTINGMPVAYPITTVAEEQVVNDSVNGQNLVVVGQRGTVTVAGNSRRAGAVTYTAGSEIRAYDRGDREFSPSTQVDVLLDTDGNEWQVTESALVGPTGERAERVNGHLAYWFGWYSFYPQTLVYGAE